MKLSQNGIQFLFEGGQHLGNNSFGIRISQRTVIRPEFQREGHALLALRNTDTTVDVKQLNAAQQLAGCGKPPMPRNLNPLPQKSSIHCP